jgi:hypothetical protein
MYGEINLYHLTGGPCAELVAPGHARATGARKLTDIVAVRNCGRGPVGRYGRDLQVLFGYHPKIRVILPTTDCVRRVKITNLMPLGAVWTPEEGTQTFDRACSRDEAVIRLRSRTAPQPPAPSADYWDSGGIDSLDCLDRRPGAESDLDANLIDTRRRDLIGESTITGHVVHLGDDLATLRQAPRPSAAVEETLRLGSYDDRPGQRGKGQVISAQLGGVNSDAHDGRSRGRK